MTVISPPPVPRGGAQPPDDVDRVLRAFYRAEMPDPWPSLEAPAPVRVGPAATKPPRRWPLMRSRIALAASVALFVACTFVLAGAFQGRWNPADRPITVDGWTADTRNDPLQRPTPPKLKVNESLIQEPGGTSLKVDVIDWPLPPK